MIHHFLDKNGVSVDKEKPAKQNILNPGQNHKQDSITGTLTTEPVDY